MNRRKIYLIISFLVTVIAAVIIEFHILLAEGFGADIIQSPTVFGEIIIVIIKVVPIIAVLYNLFLLVFDNKIPEKIHVYLTSIVVVISLPYSIFLALYLKVRLKQTKTKLDYRFGILIFGMVLAVIFTYTITASQSSLITNYRPSKYTIDYSNKVEDGIAFSDFYLGVYFFNEEYDYSVSDFEFELLDTEDIDYETIDYDRVEYDILVEDLYICKNKGNNGISFDDHCDGVQQEGSFFYGEKELSLIIRVRIYDDELLVIESEYTFNDVNEYFEMSN